MKVYVQPISRGTQTTGLIEVAVTPDSTFEDIKNIVEAEIRVPHNLLRLIYKGDNSIPDSAKVKDVGIEDQDMLACEIQQQTQRVQQQPRAIPNYIPPNLLQNLMPAQPGASANARKIMENRMAALEQSPESFAEVLMLYIDTEVNGVKVKAFVDSGAQRTVMSKDCARRCGILDIVDPAFAGVAVGVGAAKILGRVHLCPIKIGPELFASSFIVLDQSQNIELLIGLDMLKRYRCHIDLEHNVLRFSESGMEVPFLSEAEVPAHAKLNRSG